MSAVLRTDRLSRRFGALHALRDVSFALETGARHALIGPNGAGKTTLVNLLTGVLAPSGGDVFLEGERVTSLSPHLRAHRGMARTFQITTLFPNLTVLEAVVLVVCERNGIGASFWTPVARRSREIEEAQKILSDLRLAGDAGAPVRVLPYGKQRLLEIAVALATRPRVLLLDEPAAGIPQSQSAEIFSVLAGLPREVTILFIEHDMNLVFRFAERITVLVGGRVLMEGGVDEVQRDERVRAVYLGRERHD
jgi:branched-chain amino acid transport system ATP-binding protein